MVQKTFLYRAALSLALLWSAAIGRAQLPTSAVQSFFAQHPDYYTDGFDYPVGPPDAKGYYNAQKFGQNTHLGDDWNGLGGGNTDLGDPVHGTANGLVVFAQNIGGGWGNVVRVVHVLSDKPLVLVESLYAHLERIDVKEGQAIKRGEKLGTIGNAGGIYYAHLHFELRTEYGKEIGGGYSADTTGYTDPTVFIKAHRPKK